MMKRQEKGKESKDNEANDSLSLPLPPPTSYVSSHVPQTTVSSFSLSSSSRKTWHPVPSSTLLPAAAPLYVCRPLSLSLSFRENERLAVSFVQRLPGKRLDGKGKESSGEKVPPMPSILFAPIVLLLLDERWTRCRTAGPNGIPFFPRPLRQRLV